MKLLLLADPASSHVLKWANGLNRKGIEVFIFGLSDYTWNEFDKNIHIKTVDFSTSVKKNKDGSLLKSVYLTTLPVLKKYIRTIKPDIIHSHSASSYGFMGALSGFHPFFISVWGSDIFIFPKKSIFHRMILKFTLYRADNIFSTGYTMKTETEIYTSANVDVVPFGVDTSVFKPAMVESIFKVDDIVIGAVKSLDYNYGIEYLIDAFALLVEKYPALPLKLLLVGGGGMTNLLKDYATKKGISDKTVFTGLVPFSKVPFYQNMIDIAVFPSVSESFGVSVIEASACEIPVIVSNIGGLPEVVEDEVTGLIFPSKDVEKLVSKLELLILNVELRKKMGKAGRERVMKQFNWDDNLEHMVNSYNKILKNN
jgi:glycosyltransferase involved in cell wall biosynthesis